MIGVRFPAGARIFPLASVSRPALGPTQLTIQCVLEVLSPGRDADHSSHHCRGKERVEALPPLPQNASMACGERASLRLYLLTHACYEFRPSAPT
jgi:hypothetical protein